MSTLNLIELYKTLVPPEQGNDKNHLRFSACQIPGFENHRLAKDSNNFPSLLISTSGKSEVRPAPIKLEHLRVLYDVDCKITPDTTTDDSRFTVVSCTDSDAQMQEYFLRVVATIVTVIGQNPSHKEVAKVVSNLVELFRVMNDMPKKSIQGLWAELFLISIARKPEELLRAWHSTPNDIFDFATGGQRIEVKSSTSKLRQHHFSLEQLKPVSDIEIMIASVFVERIGSGVSLIEITDMIRTKLNEDTSLLLYLDQIVGSTLGNQWRSATADRFDYQLAKKTLNYYFANDIPCVSSKFPKEISNVHFTVDITELPALNKDSHKKLQGLFKAASTK